MTGGLLLGLGVATLLVIFATLPLGAPTPLVADWETAEGANAIFDEWQIDDGPGEVAYRLEGDIGLVPLP